MKMRVSGGYGLVVAWMLVSGCAPGPISPGPESPVRDATPVHDAVGESASPVESTGRDDLPERARYLPEALIPQGVRHYAEDQPVLENSWITVPRAAGFGSQDAYLLSVYPSLKALPEAERAAALRGIKRTLSPILEKSADGRENPVYALFRNMHTEAADPGRITDGGVLADLVFHAQSPFRDASSEWREALRAQLVKITFEGIDPEAIAPMGEGNRSWGGEYMLPRILRPYLLLEIFHPEVLTMEQRRTLNRVLMHPFFGFNGQLGITGQTQDILSGILNKQVFVYNSLLWAASLMELQMARYPERENLWPGFDRGVPDLFRDILAEVALNYHNGLMGDGATRYVPNYTHAYYYEGPQMDQLLRNYLNTYDETDPVLMRAHEMLGDRILAIGNYYEQTALRVVEADEDSHHMSNRAQMSEAKSFGNELVHRPSDPPIHWALANLTGNRWLRQSGPAVQAQRILDDPKKGMSPLGVDLALAAVWNPHVRIGPDPSTGPGFRQKYLFWDRNNLGATGKFGNWAFQFIGRGLTGRRPGPAAEVPPLFEKDSFAGFVARSAGSPPTAEGLRTDHRLAHVAYVGIFPEKTRFWGSVKNAHPKLDGIGPGYAPHWEAARWSATVTDGFAVQASSARSEATDAVCRELWLATPNGAVGLLSGDVSEDPKNGDGYARLSFVLQGFFGTRIRSYKKQDGFHVDPIPSPITFPTLTADGNGFDFVNLRVRVLEQNFIAGPVFAHLTKPEDFYPTDKRSPEMRGLDELSSADNESHGAVTREVQARGRFTDGRRPTAVVAVHTGDQARPVTARRLASLPGVRGEHLVLQARDGDTQYLVIYNPGDDLLDLSGWTVPESEARVRVYRSGARYRPDFLGNIEVNPEADKEDEVVHGAVVQVPALEPIREATHERIPPHGHLVIVSGGAEFRTGGPGFEVRPSLAEWRFRPENHDGSSTRELTGRGPALRGGEQTEGDAVRVNAGAGLHADGLNMPEAGTLRFWVRPETVPAKAPAPLFASGGAASWELWAAADALVLRHAGEGRADTQAFAGGLRAGTWQEVVVSYASEDPATWQLRVNDAPRTPAKRGVELPSPGTGLRLGGGFDALFRDLAVHDAVLTPGELNFLHDRGQPTGFNRIRVAGIPSHVWVNGNHLNEGSQPELVDTDKLARHLKPGVNVMGIEWAAAQNPPQAPSLAVWIRGQELTADGSPFLGDWQTLATPRENQGSRLLAAYDAQIQRQFQHLASLGRSDKEYRNPEWRPHAYDRPWLARKDTLDWQPLSGASSGENGGFSPILQSGQGLRLLRFTFVLDEHGVAQPFTP